jgi:enoyl-CoA hydratase
LETVTITSEGPVAYLTVDRPKKMNALNPQVIREIREALRQMEGSETRALVVSGAGDKAFVAGADIEGMSSMSPVEAKSFSDLSQEAFRLLERLPVPTIAAIEGFALGGGTELALACDLRVASESAVFGFPEVTLGLMPGAGGTQRLPRLVGPEIAKDMIFTGRWVKAKEAKEIGLVSRIVPKGEALRTADELATKIAANAPLGVGHAKSAIKAAGDVDLETGLRHESDLFALLFSTADAREGMSAFVQRRQAKFDGR